MFTYEYIQYVYEIAHYFVLTRLLLVDLVDIVAIDASLLSSSSPLLAVKASFSSSNSFNPEGSSKSSLRVFCLKKVVVKLPPSIVMSARSFF